MCSAFLSFQRSACIFPFGLDLVCFRRETVFNPFLVMLVSLVWIYVVFLSRNFVFLAVSLTFACKRDVWLAITLHSTHHLFLKMFCIKSTIFKLLSDSPFIYIYWWFIFVTVECFSCSSFFLWRVMWEITTCWYIICLIMCQYDIAKHCN